MNLARSNEDINHYDRTYLAVGAADGVADGLDDGLLVGEELGASEG